MHPGDTPLEELQGLLLDAQATGSATSRGDLLEIGWARLPGGEARDLADADVTAHVIAPCGQAVVPPAVARLTGLHTADWKRGVAPAVVWERLAQAAERAAAPPVPVVVHFARFEEPFLWALHQRHGSGPFPFRLVCTHAIARRLLPELPRRTLRALAGYFGAAVPLLRRSADHVLATAFVWRRLVALLAEREGVVSLSGLHAWLEQPARRAPRRFPLDRERRRDLPDRPGVYRLSRCGGSVLYVGKATSLRSRVSSHFHARQGERALEMLTQVREVSCEETATALEAALLETDEIKRLAPPYNKALAAQGRAIFFATADLDHVQSRSDARHTRGPLGSADPIEALRALRDALAIPEPSAIPRAVRARAVGVEPPWAPEPRCFADGLAQFEREHGRLEGSDRIRRVGSRLWALRRSSDASETMPDESGDDEPRASRLPAWDAERVKRALEQTVVRAAHALRRARWLLRLSECSVAWTEPGGAARRLLVIETGAVARRSDLDPGSDLPLPAGHGRSAAQRRRAFDVATFDRLRVLTTELRRLATDGASAELRFGTHGRVSPRRLRTVLSWI